MGKPPCWRRDRRPKSSSATHTSHAFEVCKAWTATQSPVSPPPGPRSPAGGSPNPPRLSAKPERGSRVVCHRERSTGILQHTAPTELFLAAAGGRACACRTAALSGINSWRARTISSWTRSGHWSRMCGFPVFDEEGRVGQDPGGRIVIGPASFLLKVMILRGRGRGWVVRLFGTAQIDHEEILGGSSARVG